MSATANNQSNAQLATQLTQEIFNRYSLAISQTWLLDFLTTVRHPLPPLPALASTANFRLLNSDFTLSLSTASNEQHQPLLPRNISDVNIKQSQLLDSVPVQILDVVDVGSSKYAQIEAIERIERGEEVRGREVIRNVPIMHEADGSGGGPPGAAGASATTGQLQGVGVGKKSAGPHKLLLQDAAGTKVWGFELVSVPKVCITVAADEGGLQIGAKMLLRKGLVVRRGFAMLDPRVVAVLGGKVEEWDRQWRAGRKQRLLDELKMESEEQAEVE